MTDIVADKDLKPSELLDRQIRKLTYLAHLEGLSTPFALSAMVVYLKGGKLSAKDEEALKKAGLLDQCNNLTVNGMTLLTSCEQRGDRPYLWAQDIAAKAQKAPKLVPQAA